MKQKQININIGPFRVTKAQKENIIVAAGGLNKISQYIIDIVFKDLAQKGFDINTVKLDLISNKSQYDAGPIAEVDSVVVLIHNNAFRDRMQVVVTSIDDSILTGNVYAVFSGSLVKGEITSSDMRGLSIKFNANDIHGVLTESIENQGKRIKAMHFVEKRLKNESGQYYLRPENETDDLSDEGCIFLSPWSRITEKTLNALEGKPIYFHKTQSKRAWIGGILLDSYKVPDNLSRNVLRIKKVDSFTGTLSPQTNWSRVSCYVYEDKLTI